MLVQLLARQQVAAIRLGRPLENLLLHGLLGSEKSDGGVAFGAALARQTPLLLQHIFKLLRGGRQVELLVQAILGLLQQRAEVREKPPIFV